MSNYVSVVATGLMLTAGSALAQTAPSTPGQLPSGPSASAPATMPAPIAISQPVRASSLMKATVHNTAGEKVADVSDLLVDPSGTVKSVILGVGGFLGIGERNVAVDLASLRMMQDSSGHIMLTSDQMKSKDEVKAMPEWKDPNKSVSSTTSTTAPKAP